MAAEFHSWRMVAPGTPLELYSAALPIPSGDELLLAVRACGLCHTDYGYLYGGVRTNASLPLTLGHEIVGEAIQAGPDVADGWQGTRYIVPAVLPCGECSLCKRGRGNVCRSQKMPGNDFDGGFASHVLVPSRFLCPLPDDIGDITAMSVVADAVSTAYQSVLRTEIGEGDSVVVIGAGGVGGYAIQCAKACGATVIALDVNMDKLAAVDRFIDLAINAAECSGRQLKQAVAEFERSHGLKPHSRKILECSGTAPGQESAFSLLNHDATLCVVGFTLEKLQIRLSNLMAFDAKVFGNWGCLPEHYPAILDLVSAGKIVIEPYVQHFPMSRLNELLAQEHHTHRPVLIPDFEESSC